MVVVGMLVEDVVSALGLLAEQHYQILLYESVCLARASRCFVDYNHNSGVCG